MYKLSSIVAVAAAFSSAQADTLNVPAEFATIQEAIDAAIDGLDEVVVADGTYTGGGNKNLDFHGKAITVRSSGGPFNCIIDCEDSGRGFIFQTGETSDAVVEGFTIRNGFDGFLFGGAMHIWASSPTIRDCRFLNNEAFSAGGAVWIQTASTPTFTDCVFNGNSSLDTGGAISGTQNDDGEILSKVVYRAA